MVIVMDTFIDRRIAQAPYVNHLDCKDGLPPMLVFSYRSLSDGIGDLFRDAIRLSSKPVPTVLSRHERRQSAPAAPVPQAVP